MTAARPAAAPAPGPAPVVSVVIPAHDAAAFLGECLDSVAAQAGGWVREVIVVDDGSRDATADVARAHAGVRLIRLPANGGPGAARNAGVAAAQGEWVAFLDADDLWPAGSLAARAAVLRRQPGAALVFGDCRQFDAGGPAASTVFEAGGLGAAAWGAGELLPEGYRRLLAGNFVTTGTVLARRAALQAAGGFAPGLRLVEDLDLWLRLARQHPLAWCGQTCLLRRRHGANLSRDPRAMSLAYLEVLQRQAGAAAAAGPGLAAELAALAAAERLHLADLALAAGRPHEALAWAWQSLRARPGLRALARVGRAWRARWSAARPAPPPGPR